MFSPPSDTNLNNFNRELFAVRSLVRVNLLTPRYGTLFNVAKRAMGHINAKELHCGLLIGKAFSVATPYEITGTFYHFQESTQLGQLVQILYNKAQIYS